MTKTEAIEGRKESTMGCLYLTSHLHAQLLVGA